MQNENFFVANQIKVLQLFLAYDPNCMRSFPKDLEPDYIWN